MKNPQAGADRPFSYETSKKTVHDGLTLQEKAYDRLNALYQISNLLSTIDSIEDLFPQILTAGARTFPILTAVLVDNWGVKPKTAIWRAESATHEQVIAATLNARDTYSFLSGASTADALDLNTDTATLQQFIKADQSQTSNENQANNYIVLPLIVNDQPPIGALQLEGGGPLNEVDLEFAVALSNLIAVALDRYYKSKSEQSRESKEKFEISTQLRGSQDKIIDLETERDQREGFVSLLTHDLRTPLAAVKMTAQLMLQVKDDQKTNQELIRRIITNINRADQMISNLLDANRIRSGEMLSLEIEEFDLTALIKDTLRDLTLLHGKRFEFTSNEKASGYWDRKAVRRILENLCTNAIKYGDENTPVIITLEQKKTTVRLSVKNHGESISQEDQKSIFKQFKRTAQAHTKKKSGWGIGLTLVKGVAEAHGGKVTIKSEASVGTVFAVTLPKDSRDFISHVQ